MIKIYKLTFADGAAYVGQTVNSVQYRIKSHIKTPCNTELKIRLLDEYPTIEVLSRHATRRNADIAEQRQIKLLEKPINRLHVPGLPPSPPNTAMKI